MSIPRHWTQVEYMQPMLLTQGRFGKIRTTGRVGQCLHKASRLGSKVHKHTPPPPWGTPQNAGWGGWFQPPLGISPFMGSIEGIQLPQTLPPQGAPALPPLGYFMGPPQSTQQQAGWVTDTSECLWQHSPTARGTPCSCNQRKDLEG